MKRWLAAALMLALLTGCAAEPAASPASPSSASSSSFSSASSASASSEAAEAEEAPAPLGTGRFLVTETEDGAAIDRALETLTLELLGLYYESLARLELCPLTSLEALFAGEMAGQAAANRSIWQYQVASRAMQPIDLRLLDYAPAAV